MLQDCVQPFTQVMEAMYNDIQEDDARVQWLLPKMVADVKDFICIAAAEDVC